MNKKIIVANWKMNFESLAEAKKNFSEIKKTASVLQNVQTVICPPFLYLIDLKKMYNGNKILIGAQDVFEENRGGFTGAVSPNMLKKNKIDFVIIGHSEKRNLGENDEIVNKKIKIALEVGLKIILCVGEKSRSDEAGYFNFLKNQILSNLEKIKKDFLEKIIIAYEPVWVISGNGGKKSLEPSDIYEMIIFIKKVLFDKYGEEGSSLKILYGGSVNVKNAKKILEVDGVGGLLVGKESLTPKKFNQILQIAND